MSERVHLLAQSILGKSSLEECTLQETRELAQRYPYFAPAQFLYLQKLKAENEEDYLKQLQKAVLYYHNPLAFEYFISSDRFLTEVDFNQQVPQAINDQPVLEPVKDQESITPDQQPEAAIMSDNVVQIAESTLAPVEESVIAVDETPVLPANEEKKPAPEKHMANENPEVPEITAPSEPETKNQKPETELAFEPYHTVDYFASQGIKLSQEEVSKDKFGKQLKSFTEWLKTMKRLPANQVNRLDTTTEKKVEHLAEDSVHNADVITEAMAEVWLKQGNREKAMETYNKLSLLNPSKRAYFAALIENLKRS